ncbi:alpha/beta fold hydrolase [Brevundimonas sp. SL161]|uniref:alpha/beta fold hydrolase n=1 Tax=Brevundimonas sp. SL161 TaxID=2804613 RepID=UPI003CF1CBA8
MRDTGPRDAPAVILLHGFGASLHTWEPWAGRLDDELRVIRLDLPGAGLSPPDPAGDYTDARATALLLALMDLLQIERASFVGHSVGGRIAWTMAAEHPDRVDRLVLISPDGFASPGFEYGQAPEVPFVMGLTLAPGARQAMLDRMNRPCCAIPFRCWGGSRRRCCWSGANRTR